MTITITAFDRSPDGGRGSARDTRVQWAPKEASHPWSRCYGPTVALGSCVRVEPRRTPSAQ